MRHFWLAVAVILIGAVTALEIADAQIAETGVASGK